MDHIVNMAQTGVQTAQQTDSVDWAGVVIGTYFGVLLVLYVIRCIALWKIFGKYGEPGWVALVPVMNTFILCKHTWGSGWYMFITLVRIVGDIFTVITMYKLAKSFGKSGAFTLGIIFLQPVFLMILAFGKDMPESAVEKHTPTGYYG